MGGVDGFVFEFALALGELYDFGLNAVVGEDFDRVVISSDGVGGGVVGAGGLIVPLAVMGAAEGEGISRCALYRRPGKAYDFVVEIGFEEGEGIL